jgi:hypothetical protein
MRLVPPTEWTPKRILALLMVLALIACDTGAASQDLTRIGARVKREFSVDCMVTSAKRDGQIVVTVYLRDLPPSLPGTLHPKVEDLVLAEVPKVDRVVVLARVRGEYRPVF